MKKIKILVLILVILFIAIQFIPVKRDNPPVVADMPDTETVKAILQKSCYDCHSNTTTWPWYSYVAPVSWLVSFDVHHGREYLNFSDWGSFNDKQIKYYKQNIWYEIDRNNMPLRPYLLLHPEARLNQAAKDSIKIWVQAPDSSGIVQP